MEATTVKIELTDEEVQILERALSALDANLAVYKVATANERSALHRLWGRIKDAKSK